MRATTAAVSLTEAQTCLGELTWRVWQRNERILLTCDGEAEAVLLSMDELDGLELTLEILGRAKTTARIRASLTALESGEPGVDVGTVRSDLARHHTT